MSLSEYANQSLDKNYYEGMRIGEIWGFVSNGLWQDQAGIDAAEAAAKAAGQSYYNPLMQTSKTYKLYPGDIKFEDLNGNGYIDRGQNTVDDPGDRKIIGNEEPRYIYSFTLSADWKGLDFSAFFQGSIGNDIYKLYRRSNVTFGNYDKSWLNRWHGEGTSNWVPRIIDGDNNNYQVSNFFVEDGSYMCLKVLQIGYSLPGQMLQRVGIKGLRFFVQGENLFTITNYSGYDPEVGTRDGFDGGTYPQARTYTIGANITF